MLDSGLFFDSRRPAIWPLVRAIPVQGPSLRVPRMGGLANSVGVTGNAPPTSALSRWRQAPIGEASMFDIVRFKGDLERPQGTDQSPHAISSVSRRSFRLSLMK